ncbi:MAG: GH25 family lysozyme [Trebonia sp.]
MAVAGGLAAAVSLAASPMAMAATARLGRSPMRGIDISAYQHADGPVNWRLLARHGIRFVAIKVTEGTYYTNPYYLSDARNAARAGLAVMPYVFANPAKAGGPATASFAIAAAHYRHRGAALPLVVDLENDPYASSNCYWTGSKRMISWIAGFTRRVRALTGTSPIIYTTAAWWKECTRSTARFRSDPLWLADYNAGRPAAPRVWARWAFWQYSDEGFLPGIGWTDVDYYQPVNDLPSLRPKARAKPRPKHRSPQKRRPKTKRKDSHKSRPKHKAKSRPKHKAKSRPKHKAKSRPKHPRKHKPKHKSG